MNKEKEIRKLLSKRYHLCVSWENDIITWKLFKQYENGDPIYYSNDNKPIMTSETHTPEQLYKFAKIHHKIDEHLFLNKMNVNVSFIVMILIITNIIFFKNDFIKGILMGIDVMIVLYCIVSHIIWNKNWKVDTLELKENFKRLRDENS